MSPHTEARWRASQSRSLDRRASAARSRRNRLRGRTLAIVLAVAMTALPGVALAAGTGSSGGRASAAATTLKLGANGTAVKRLQRKLHVQVTGYYGDQTEAAVKRFQRSHRLKADGVAGPATLRALGIRARQASYSSGGASPDEGSGSTAKVPAVLQKIAQCESGGNPRAISPSGQYRGKYQFDRATWKRWGGSGDPAAASESVQDRIALKLYKARGTSPWPNCA